ncbi:lipid II:glycine glycyltransferase FemX [Desulfurivibrio sp. D14AmB]|uniref:lipid II:glycine glycyltransferase FemX n=1 Tax=Desulfurivibrio sp. D14AmB TaxID=3374370 RepID=UPI00376F362F
MSDDTGTTANNYTGSADRGTSLESSASVDDQEWDHFLNNCDYGHHEQCSRYAANRNTYGYQCNRVVVENGGVAVGGVQILVQSTPLGKFAHIQRGPLAVDDDLRVMRQVVKDLEETARLNAYRSVRVDLFPHQTTARKALEEAGFICSSFHTCALRSVTVPLHLADDELLTKMHKKVAYEARRALKNGVTVLAGGESSVGEFYELHQASSGHQAFPIFPREYFDYLWRLFGPVGKVQPFIAYHNGKPMASLFNTIVGDHMYFGWGGMSRTTEARRLRVNYLLHLTAMTWARAHGCSRYDFAGTEPFKQWFAVDIIQWPHALRKVYGPAAGWRWKMMELTDASPFLKHAVNKMIKIMGLRQRMPL